MAFFVIALLPYVCRDIGQQKAIRSGELWPDVNGNHINAHGGGILYHQGIYYWFGEHKCDTKNRAMAGVMCYSSKDLTSWKEEGVALIVEDDPDCKTYKGCVLERPKVIYNTLTDKFVMWFHLELNGLYLCVVCLAESDSLTGPYTYLGSGRVNVGQLPFDKMDEDITAMYAIDSSATLSTGSQQWTVQKGLFLKRNLTGGQMARDITIYINTDGKAYHISPLRRTRHFII